MPEEPCASGETFGYSDYVFTAFVYWNLLGKLGVIAFWTCGNFFSFS